MTSVLTVESFMETSAGRDEISGELRAADGESICRRALRACEALHGSDARAVFLVRYSQRKSLVFPAAKRDRLFPCEHNRTKCRARVQLPYPPFQRIDGAIPLD